MRSPQQQLLYDRLRSLPERPSEAEIEATVVALVNTALAAKQPLMSVGASLRHAAASLSPGIRKRLREAANAEIIRRSALPEPPITIPLATHDWRTVREAARELGCSEAVLLDRLHQYEHRRRLGWPMFDGYRWLIPAAALDPMRRAAFLLAQPDEEPLPDLLPPACERGPRPRCVPLSIEDSAVESVPKPAKA